MKLLTNTIQAAFHTALIQLTIIKVFLFFFYNIEELTDIKINTKNKI